MNVLLSLTPKNLMGYLTNEMTVRQAVEKIREQGFSMLPVIDRETGVYIRSVRANDLLDYIVNERLSFQELEERPLEAVASSWEIKAISANADITSLFDALSPRTMRRSSIAAASSSASSPEAPPSKP